MSKFLEAVGMSAAFRVTADHAMKPHGKTRRLIGKISGKTQWNRYNSVASDNAAPRRGDTRSEAVLEAESELI
jgi:hypothetical protein